MHVRLLLPLGLATALLPVVVQSAAAQGYGGLLPNLGTDARVGDLRTQLEGYLRPAAPLSGRPAWIITPAIEGYVGVTDNALRTTQARRADVFTEISPQVSVSGDTSRVTLNLSYTPQVTVYADNSSQNQISQFGAGQAKVIVVPDLVFVDFLGSITQQSLTGGGFNQYQTQSYSRQNDVQTIALSISPYIERQFGGWGKARLSYAFNRTLQDSTDNQTVLNSNQAALQTYGQPGYGTLGNLTTHTETGTFTSGENLGRFNDQVVVTATQYSGGNSYSGAGRKSGQNELDYALSHSLYLLTGLGYEDIAYGGGSGTAGYRSSGLTYNIGTRYAPSPDLSLTIQYGRHDASTNLSFDGQWAPTARSQISARYTTGITTDLEQAQNQLRTTTVGPGGVITDTQTGAPVLLNNYNGVQNGVYRSKQLSVSVIYVQERDSYSLSIANQNRTSLTTTPTLIGNSIVPAGTSTTSTYGSIGWQHDLAPNMALSATGQYGISSNTSQLIGTGNQDQTTLSVTAALTRQFTETLSGSVRYTYIKQSGGQLVTTAGINTGNYSQNTLLVGLRKSF